MNARIVVCKSVGTRIGSFVSTLKDTYNFTERDLAAQKERMLAFVSDYIGQVFQRLNNASPEQERYAVSYCYYNDGTSPYSWVFDYKICHNQGLVIIYNFRKVNKFTESKEVKANTNIKPAYSKQNTIRLTEAELKQCIKESTISTLSESFNFPNGLSLQKTNERFLCTLSRLYQNNKITIDEFNELLHYGMYYNPYYTNGYAHDCRNKKNKSVTNS